jgi:hypothetical protein
MPTTTELCLTWRTTVVAALIGALASVGGNYFAGRATQAGADATLAGARYGAESVVQTTLRQLEAERQKKTRQPWPGSTRSTSPPRMTIEARSRRRCSPFVRGLRTRIRVCADHSRQSVVHDR